MKISELPSKIKEKAIFYREECGDTSKTEDDLSFAFSWQHTREGYNFWNRWYLKWQKTYKPMTK
jgi:hypothetical protein